ncbi:DUF4263 domain-containing protein [Avibacterium gallinarum]|uniref:Uncharacterized protein DUF4263 n=1 Tax=Avibacterium gallinarum TaxID=755 RepID=A0A379B023_AVIGA|nr:Shedu anti-phage system protein SduA domain-containing protein [Avibacterium gallinarum]POY44202.1 DUF4263 domain-containing protein [Avibacterium gallinarum]TDP29270.1 uncharacterized protein DUF4263 [Avibacterium gallinarum]SUB28198.1 Uncharacterised protein [Avibacterium gallinarum]
MKISDFIFDFQSNIKNANNGFCRVRIFSAKDGVIVILTELDNNDGMSITNCIEDIVRGLYEEGFILDSSAKFIEHYEEYNSYSYTPFSFNSVTFENNITSPEWERISLQKLIDMIGISYKDDLITNSLKNRKIFEKTQELISQHKNFSFSKYHKNPDYTRRFLDIENKKKTKAALKNIIENGGKERKDLLPFLRSDLSLLGEMYSHIEDEYIVIPEFPLGSGFIDFVVFAGRSRMDVIFIEIKGANFNLINSTGYKDFHSDIHKAAKQLRDRIDISVYHDYDNFRKECHSIREKIENNKYSPHHLLSPKGKLLVDPNKDICLKTVIIGGRSQNDYDESRERHKFERDHAIPIELDSWDSWLNRVIRD